MLLLNACATSSDVEDAFTSLNARAYLLFGLFDCLDNWSLFFLSPSFISDKEVDWPSDKVILVLFGSFALTSTFSAWDWDATGGIGWLLIVKLILSIVSLISWNNF